MLHGQAVARVLPVDRVNEQRAVDKLLKFVATLPVRHPGEWTRDDLHE